MAYLRSENNVRCCPRFSGNISLFQVQANFFMLSVICIRNIHNPENVCNFGKHSKRNKKSKTIFVVISILFRSYMIIISLNVALLKITFFENERQLVDNAIEYSKPLNSPYDWQTKYLCMKYQSMLRAMQTPSTYTAQSLSWHKLCYWYVEVIYVKESLESVFYQQKVLTKREHFIILKFYCILIGDIMT